MEADLYTCSDEEFQKLISRLVKKGIHGLILAEESETKNFSLYMRLMELCKNDIPNDIQCCCRCGNNTMRQLFVDYYSDHRQEGCIAPKFFSVSEMRAFSIMNHTPLPHVNANENLKILIGGFGHTGQKLLLDSIVMGISSSTNAIEIDVVDINIEQRKEEFLKRFSKETFNITEDCCTLKTSVADGSLVIHFYDMDICGNQFVEHMKKNQYSYAALCIEDVKTCVLGIIEMNRILAARKEEFPITVSLMTDPEIAMYLEKEQQRYHHVYISGAKEFLNVDYILHTTLEDQARKFHETYCKISLSSLLDYRNHQPFYTEAESPVVRWTTMALYKQEDNRFVSRHQQVKEAVVKELLGDDWRKSLDQYFGENGTIFKPRENTYVFDVSAEELIRKINADPFLHELGAMEHRRWCHVKAMSGWNYAEKKNDNLKETPYLLGWDELCRKYPDMCLYDFMPLLMMLQEG